MKFLQKTHIVFSCAIRFGILEVCIELYDLVYDMKVLLSSPDDVVVWFVVNVLAVGSDVFYRPSGSVIE